MTCGQCLSSNCPNTIAAECHVMLTCCRSHVLLWTINTQSMMMHSMHMVANLSTKALPCHVLVHASKSWSS